MAKKQIFSSVRDGHKKATQDAIARLVCHRRHKSIQSDSHPGLTFVARKNSGRSHCKTVLQAYNGTCIAAAAWLFESCPLDEKALLS